MRPACIPGAAGMLRSSGHPGSSGAMRQWNRWKWVKRVLGNTSCRCWNPTRRWSMPLGRLLSALIDVECAVGLVVIRSPCLERSRCCCTHWWRRSHVFLSRKGGAWVRKHSWHHESWRNRDWWWRWRWSHCMRRGLCSRIQTVQIVRLGTVSTAQTRNLCYILRNMNKVNWGIWTSLTVANVSPSRVWNWLFEFGQYRVLKT